MTVHFSPESPWEPVPLVPAGRRIKTSGSWEPWEPGVRTWWEPESKWEPVGNRTDNTPDLREPGNRGSHIDAQKNETAA